MKGKGKKIIYGYMILIGVFLICRVAFASGEPHYNDVCEGYAYGVEYSCGATCLRTHYFTDTANNAYAIMGDLGMRPDQGGPYEWPSWSSDHPGWSEGKYLGYGARKWDDTLGGYIKYAFMYPIGDYLTSGCMEEVGQDSDEDGIPDKFDPFPDDGSPFDYKIVARQYSDGPGSDVSWMLIELEDGSFFEIGEKDGDDSVYMDVGSPWKDSETNYMEDIQEYTGSGSGGSWGGDQIEIGPGGDFDTGSGIGNEGNTQDLDYLADIVDNTKNTTNNQGIISDQLTEVNSNLNDLKEIASQIGQDGGGDVNVNVDVEGIGQSVADEISEDREAEGQEAETEGQAALDGVSDPSFDGDVSGDVPEKNLLSDVVSNFLSNNPVSQYLNNSGVECSGACSIDWEWKGHNIQFTICPYAEELQTWGAVMLGIVSLISLFIVVKR
jgi:hypothetical protein